MNFTVVTEQEADNDIRAIDHWWRENRPAAPDLFLEELAEAFAALAAAPEIGRRIPRRGVPGVRRNVLRATRYHVYYVRLSNTFQRNIADVVLAARSRGVRQRGVV